MARADPLVQEAAIGLTGAGASQRAYLGGLALQALALVAWWPKGGVYGALQSGDGPDTLLAVLVVCGLTTAYHAVRSGAEELLLPHQHTLREWLDATPLSPWRIARGYLAGHLLQATHAVALSSPLVLAAFSVSGGEWPALGWAVLMILVQSACYRLGAAVVYLAIGHRGELCFWTVRAAVVAVYVGTAVWSPIASHPIACARLLAGDGPALAGAIPAHVVFVAVYALVGAVLWLALGRQLARERTSI